MARTPAFFSPFPFAPAPVSHPRPYGPPRPFPVRAACAGDACCLVWPPVPAALAAPFALFAPLAPVAPVTPVTSFAPFAPAALAAACSHLPMISVPESARRRNPAHPRAFVAFRTFLRCVSLSFRESLFETETAGEKFARRLGFFLFSFLSGRKKREPEKKAIKPLGLARYARPSAELTFPAKNILRGFSERKAPQGKTGAE